MLPFRSPAPAAPLQPCLRTCRRCSRLCCADALTHLFCYVLPSCPLSAVFEDVPPLQQIMPPTQDGSATVTFDQPGVYW